MKPETKTFRIATTEDVDKAMAELREKRRVIAAREAAKNKENKSKAASMLGAMVMARLPEWKMLDYEALDRLFDEQRDDIARCCRLDEVSSDAALRRMQAAKKRCAGTGKESVQNGDGA